MIDCKWMDESQLDISSALKEGKRAIRSATISVRAGALVFSEADITRDAYLVKQGSLVATVRIAGQNVEVAHYADGDLFGVLGLIDGQPRNLTVRALTECQLSLVAASAGQTMVQSIPPWLFAALRYLAARLRESTHLVNRHTVLDPLESICQFLVMKCCVANPKDRKAPCSFPWFELMDEFCLVSRIPLEEARALSKELISLGLASLNVQQVFTIPDPETCEIVRASLQCERTGEPYVYADLDPLVLACLAALPRVSSRDPMSLDSFFEFWRASASRNLQTSHMEIIRALGVLVGTDADLRIDKERCDWVLKANRESQRIRTRLRGAA